MRNFTRRFRASHDHALELSFRKGVGRGRSEKTFARVFRVLPKPGFFLVRMETGNGTRNGGVDEVGLNQTFRGFATFSNFQSRSLVAEAHGSTLRTCSSTPAPHMFLPPSRNAVIARVGRCEGSPSVPKLQPDSAHHVGGAVGMRCRSVATMYLVPATPAEEAMRGDTFTFPRPP